jgi:hypothetical protein
MNKTKNVFRKTEEMIRKPWFLLATGIILIILGLLFSDIPIMILSPGWATTEGVIIKRTFLGQRFEEYDGDYYYNVDGFIRFQYEVENITYQATSLNAISIPCYPYEIAVQYPNGRIVTVYYNP